MPITSRLPIVSIGRSRQREVSSLRTSRPDGRAVRRRAACFSRKVSAIAPEGVGQAGAVCASVRSRPGSQVDPAAINRGRCAGPAALARPPDSAADRTPTRISAPKKRRRVRRVGPARTRGAAQGAARQLAASRRTTPLAGQPPIAGGLLGSALECFRRRLRQLRYRRAWRSVGRAGRGPDCVGARGWALPTIFGRQAQPGRSKGGRSHAPTRQPAAHPADDRWPQPLRRGRRTPPSFPSKWCVWLCRSRPAA